MKWQAALENTNEGYSEQKCAVRKLFWSLNCAMEKWEVYLSDLHYTGEDGSGAESCARALHRAYAELGKVLVAGLEDGTFTLTVLGETVIDDNEEV